MARIRSVKPGLFSSYSMSKVSIPARYLFIGLFAEADDDGRLIDSPKRIAGALFPHDETVAANKIEKWLVELATAKGEDGSPCIIRYHTESGRYIAIPAWLKHQKISHPLPSTLPPPPAAALAAHTNGSGGIPE